MTNAAAVNSGFALTRWTLVERACGDSAEARIALSELCAAYYAPVVSFLRRAGRDEDAARDLAHGFFAGILARGTVGSAEQERGKFRSFMLGALKHHLAHEHERAGRQKRGGDVGCVSLDSGTATAPGSGLAIADPQALPPDAFFDRQWALVVLDRALAGLEKQMLAEDKGDQFAQLRPWLTGDAAYGDQAATARELGLSEGALKVAVHRLRKRFRGLVRAEVSQTLAEPTAVEEEMRVLFAALGG